VVIIRCADLSADSSVAESGTEQEQQQKPNCISWSFLDRLPDDGSKHLTEDQKDVLEYQSSTGTEPAGGTRY